MNRVPNIAQVVRGAGVNIVLKVDQPTGKTVSGHVQDVLTRGNHPRGIKVRLADGRVGRVQSMASNVQPYVPAEGTQPGFSSEDAPQPSRHGGRGVTRDSHRDLRGEMELPSQTIGLDAYIKPAKQKKKGKGPTPAINDAPATTSEEKAEILTCPVCGDFKGDAAAIEHHVGSHFD
ncbi:hypothetical protein F5X68DRAFT_160947, partial [Plectosphaerella plurivora]